MHVFKIVAVLGLIACAGVADTVPPDSGDGGGDDSGTCLDK